MSVLIAVLADIIQAMVTFLQTTVKDTIAANALRCTPIITSTETMPFITRLNRTSCNIIIVPTRVSRAITTSTNTLAKFLTCFLAHHQAVT